MNMMIFSLIKNLMNIKTNHFIILFIITVFLGIYKTNNAQASSFILNQEGFPNSGQIIGFFSGKDKNNDGFLTEDTRVRPDPLENELTSWSFQYISGENVPNFFLDDNDVHLTFSYDLLNNQLDIVNLQVFTIQGEVDGEFGYIYDKNRSIREYLGFVFLGGPGPNSSDVSFEVASVSSVQTNEYSSIKSLLTLSILGLATRLKLKRKLD